MYRPKVEHDGDDEYCPRHSKEKRKEPRAYASNKMLIQAHAFLFFSFFFSSFLWQGGEFFIFLHIEIIRVFFFPLLFPIFKMNVEFGQNSQFFLYILLDIRVSLFFFYFFKMLGLGKILELFFTYYLILEFLSSF
jgi:hypothetical protein